MSDLGKYYNFFLDDVDLNFELKESKEKIITKLTKLPLPKGFNSSIRLKSKFNINNLKWDIEEKNISKINRNIRQTYKIFSDMDKAIIKDFNMNNKQKKANLVDLNSYVNSFLEHFYKSRAGLLLVNKGLLPKQKEKIKKKKWKFLYNDKWFVATIFNFQKKQSEIKFTKAHPKDLIKKSGTDDDKNHRYGSDSLRKRFYIPSSDYLIYIKPLRRYYWTKSEAYKDSLYENELIFENIEIK